MAQIEQIIGPHEDRQAICLDYDRRAVEVAPRVAAWAVTEPASG
jgi:hypothetical protein